MHEVRQQREREKAMGDGRLERRFAAGALNVNVDPLVVKRGISKLLNAFLCNLEPASNRNFLANQIFERVGGIKYALGHGVPFFYRNGRKERKEQQCMARWYEF
jgi:hypothetical protein